MRQFRRLVDPLHASLIALENGEDRSAATISLLNAMGVESGTPDLVLLIAAPRVHWIEIKLAKTDLHPATNLFEDQRTLHELLGWYGFRVSVIRSADEFWALIDAEGIPHGPRPASQPRLELPKPRKRRKAA